MSQVDLQKYTQFVTGVTSNTSNNVSAFTDAVFKLECDNNNLNVPLLITCGLGLPGEAGEFTELVKKLVFHGKPFTEELRTHMAKELGDIIWYWTNACRALDLDPNQVIADNVAKLEARYPGGTFDVFAAENRKDGDI